MTQITPCNGLSKGNMANENPLLETSQKWLSEIPPPGDAQCHVDIALHGVANTGIMAGIESQRVFNEIR